MVQTNRKLAILELSLALGLAVALIWGTWSLRSQRQLADRVVRLHVLANSDSKSDQALKLKVRDVILKRAEEILKSSHNRKDAERKLRAALPELQRAAQKKIASEGYSYAVRTELRDTAFPTRKYENFTLPAGNYLALRVLIGSGQGHNWWCVVFPPLCTQTTTDLSKTAMAAGLSEDDVKLMTEENGRYVLKFKSIELWEKWRAKLSR
jgi:stage II sporulation protein R